MNNQNLGSQIPPVEPQNQGVPVAQSNKKLTTGLSLLVTALLVLVGYLLFGNKTVAPEKVEDNKQTNDQIQPIENQVAGWKTYSNARANFEVRYPSELAIKAGRSISGGETVQFSSGKSEVAEILVNVEGGTLSDVYSSLENALDGMRGVNKFSSNVNQEAGTISVGGVIGYKFQTVMANNTNEIVREDIVFGKYGLIYIITFQEQISGQSKEFLSSFKFTTQAETANWKTYSLSGTNTSLQFSYPESMGLVEKNQKKFLDGSNFSLVTLENNQLLVSVFVNDPGRGLGGELTVNKKIQVAGIEASYQGLATSAEMEPDVSKRKKGALIQFFKDGDEYAILFWYSASGIDQTQVINEILASVKFTQ
ncbi:MAG: hypothetical protein A3A96_03545 [Candidatus Zambryskibacteria bacterium RIFCSPLOWO2_01_FULL_39_39]|uniref:Uncharacterized protein n=1 Tax=Candidatus Zambryskibacteria bacterium RIFCSPLOWO2_01_FULL_39_39 TaxID=1802758 RepID=A0A1G2TXU6_9BACT|nr:MAG: hypothetical protein A2644_00805 [Candidatus Zambryskibacteria bacterium RIFCSPHIGHO2_01_FULL_39_63]OHA95146.1 MAG: hypothetical protein A3B88_02835 [Candidatus Zambryskibacteria bacterium RIFCSPHIGHO2_02_FULL_39_19]OHA98642.1 MAG: hypothetical protein A3F20_00095 [Candidatus Zambryskibacteria bacterium RIFCSPHIGHO2_12_FULL_39_21]OHB02054.1 MAG: hypothetical protein A3A96_03545 [Candidatus Zambryskibacteria bacterium RIFCSPLOWO2_01_FULL_39_39]